MEKTIFIIDADATRKNNTSSRLRTQEYEVDSTRSGFQALNLLENNKYNCVLLFDSPIDMPWNELFHLIRVIGDKEKIPVLFISKTTEKEELEEAYLAGLQDFISFTPNYFGELIKKMSKIC